jgi:hypothetical protein
MIVTTRPLAGLLALCWLALGAGAAELLGEIRQVTGEAVYIDAGAREGLRLGQQGRVLREGRELARIEVQYLAATRASCRVLGEDTATLRAGDRVVFELEPGPPPPSLQEGAAGPAISGPPMPLPLEGTPAPALNSPPPVRQPAAALPGPRIRGRLLAELAGVQAGTRWREADQRLSLDAAGFPLESSLRLRAHRRDSRRPGRVPSARMDQLALSGRAATVDWNLGRFHSTAAALLGTLDGAELGWRPAAGLRLGLLLGRAAAADRAPGDRGLGLGLSLGERSSAWRAEGLALRLRGEGFDQDRLLLGAAWQSGRQGLRLRQEARFDRSRAPGEGSWRLARAWTRLQLPMGGQLSGELSLRLDRGGPIPGRASAADSLFDRSATRLLALRLGGPVGGARWSLGASLRGGTLDGDALRRLEAQAAWPAQESPWLPAPRTALAWQQAPDGGGLRASAGLRWRLPAQAGLELGGGRLQLHSGAARESALDWLRLSLDGRISRRLDWSLEGDWERGEAGTRRRQSLGMVWRF